MYIKVKEMLVNVNRVCYFTRVDNLIFIYYEYSEEACYHVKYDSAEEAETAYKAIESLLIKH